MRITVVKVEPSPPKGCRVWFSEPVRLQGYIGAYDNWWSPPHIRDGLGGFMWGLEVIQQHEETQDAQDT